MKKTEKIEITEKTETIDTIQGKEQLSSTYFSSFASLTDLCRKVPSVQYLLEEWYTEYNSDPERNSNLNHISSPNNIRSTDKSLVWWKCKNSHSWQQLISNRVKAGVGCPYCSHRKVLQGFNDLEYLYLEIAKEWIMRRTRKSPVK